MPWWGVASGAGALALVGLVAPSAVAHRASVAVTGASVAAKPVVHPVPVRKPPAVHGPVHGPVHGKSNGHGNGNGHGDGHGNGHGGPPCPYPPNGTAAVQLSGPSHAAAGSAVRFTGSASVNRCGYHGAAVGLYVSRNGRTGWARVAKTVTNDHGAIVVSYRSSGRGTVYVRLVVAGQGGLNAAQSPVRRVVVA